MLVMGPFSGFCAAHQHKAGITSLALFTIVGLIVGIGLGQVSRKLAYSVLRSKTLPGGLQFLFICSFRWLFFCRAFNASIVSDDIYG